jgi:L-ascorbate metabolism protein UlaG (beta-lactamase superfamily)
MKKTSVLTIFLGLGIGLAGFGLTPQEALQRIAWYGQSSLRIELGGKVVWLDPVKVPVAEKADLILLTHSHGDHFSAADVKKLSGPDTIVFAAFDGPGLTRIRPGEARKLGAITIEAVSAYNIAKMQNHPKANLWCGYIVSVDGVRIYDAGDTELIPEMKDISCDIVFLPLGQTYTMGSVDEAVQAALDVKAKIAIPFHYGMYEGTAKDADAFVQALTAKGVQALRFEKR